MEAMGLGDQMLITLVCSKYALSVKTLTQSELWLQVTNSQLKLKCKSLESEFLGGPEFMSLRISKSC